MTKKRKTAANHQAAELLAGDRIAEIEQVTGKTLIIVDPQRVIAEAEALAFSDITHVLACTTIDELKALPEAVRHAIRRVEQVATETKDPRTGEVTKRVHLKIEMHNKIEPLKLLALITEAIKPAAQRDDDKRPAFTGFNLLLGLDPQPALPTENEKP